MELDLTDQNLSNGDGFRGNFVTGIYHIMKSMQNLRVDLKLTLNLSNSLIPGGNKTTDQTIQYIQNAILS